MARDRVQLFIASFLMLFTELVLIRWAGAYVIYLSYFANFVLLGSFLGIGIGFLRAHKSPDLFRWAPLALAFFLGAVVAFPVTIDREGGDLVYFGVQQHGFPPWLMLPFVFVATAVTMATIAQGVATRFSRFSALDAYRLDILGSLAGIATFACLALAGLGPISWGIVIAALFVPLLTRPTLLQWLAMGIVVVVLAIGTFKGDTVWSPYYRLTVWRSADATGIDANGIPHQSAASTVGTDYEVPYERLQHAPTRVLVIGAGNGNDVSVALRNGAAHVDAVEIDPEIQQIGVDDHPEHPYQDPRVSRIVDDGRAFLGRTAATYDLIIFALPDSLTLVTGQSAIRLESYLFTEEAIRSAKDHLAPGGVFVMYNFYRERWLADRLAGTLADVFGVRPCVDLGSTANAGIGQKSIFTDSADPTSINCATVWDPGTRTVVPPAVDDRPFVYLRTPSIPLRYVLTLSLILGVSVIAVRTMGTSYRQMRRYLDLFFMGAAFLLLETKSVVQFALLFGTTWFVNTLVFAGILLFVLLAIEVERRTRGSHRPALYGLLYLSLFVAWMVPTESLLHLAVMPRFLSAVSLAFVPIFLANLIFAERFRHTADPTAAFGANLLGAIVGGTLEYLSLVTGYRALLLLVGILYGLAYVTTPRETKVAAGGSLQRGLAEDVQGATSST
jgi:SAM-dependent methyltransferase